MRGILSSPTFVKAAPCSPSPLSTMTTQGHRSSPSSAQDGRDRRYSTFGGAPFPSSLDAQVEQLRAARRGRYGSTVELHPKQTVPAIADVIAENPAPVSIVLDGSFQRRPPVGEELTPYPKQPSEEHGIPSSNEQQVDEPEDDFLFGKHLTDSDIDDDLPAPSSTSATLPDARAEDRVKGNIEEYPFPSLAPAGSSPESSTVPYISIFPGQYPAFQSESDITDGPFGPRRGYRPSFTTPQNHTNTSNVHESHQSSRKFFLSGSTSSFHTQSFSSSQSSSKGHDTHTSLPFTGSQMPSPGLWNHLRETSFQSPQSGHSVRHVPNGLRTLFGLDCRCSGKTESAPHTFNIGSVSTPRDQQDSSLDGAQSLEGIWNLVNIMSGESTSTPMEAFKPFPKGFQFSISPYSLSPSTSPLQRTFHGTGTIDNELADTLCATLGVEGLLRELNRVLGTQYVLQDGIFLLLQRYVSDPDMDFGRAYGELRRGWFCDIGTLNARLQNRQSQDEEIRQQAIDANRGLVIDPHTPPRRVWDLYSNRVLPFWALLSSDVPRQLWAVSHAWVDPEQRQLVRTRINNGEWPVPIPHDVDLEQVRVELLNLGAEYVWLDVLCLRQKIRGDGELTAPLNAFEERLEQQRKDEWAVDVPTIGYVYQCRPSQVVVTYFTGLGRPFSVSKTTLQEPRAWINRVWTMQETTSNWLLGGLALQPFDDRNPEVSDVLSESHERMCKLRSLLSQEVPDIFALITFLLSRKASHDVDFIAALGYLLKCPAIPLYDEDQSVEDAWDLLLRQLHPKHLTDLLVMYPDARRGNRHKWRPSWKQLRGYCPPSTPPVTYTPRDLLHCDTSQPLPGGSTYVNYGYVIRHCNLVRMSDSMVSLQVPVGRVGAKNVPTVSFRVHLLTDNHNPFEKYSAVGVADLEYWVLGKIVVEGNTEMAFEKVAVFRIPDSRERERLWHLNPGFSDVKISYA